MLHFPVYLPVRGTDEFAVVNVNEKMQKCLPVFTSRELAEMYIADEKSGLDLAIFDNLDSFAQVIRQMATLHGITHYAINFTFSPTSVRCGPLLELLQAS